MGAALALAPSAADAAPETVETFALDPVGGGHSCNNGRNCASCHACRNHAANKIFRTREAAADPRNRAHPRCICTVIAGQTLQATIANTIFGRGDIADRRNPDVARLLGGGGGGGVPVPIIAGTAPVILVAGGAAAYWWTKRRNADKTPVDVPT